MFELRAVVAGVISLFVVFIFQGLLIWLISLPIQAASASLLPDESVTPEEGLRQLKGGVERLSHEAPTAPHPAFGKMASEEVMQLHLRHCEMHMSFIVPSENGQSPA